MDAMRISSKTVYALRALFDIAFHSMGRPTKVDAIAEREDVPPRFLEQIFQDLKAAGLVGSKRGPSGGYFLRRSASSVTVGDVVRAIEGPLDESLSVALEGGRDGSGGAVTSKCVTAAMWGEVVGRIEGVLDSVTLSDLAAKGDALGLQRDSNADFSWVI